jgi:hypothetical protein
MGMNSLMETFMNLGPEQLAKLYLFFDCQPFSESLLTKGILALLKYRSHRPEQYLRTVGSLSGIFSRLHPDALNVVGGGTCSLYLMLEHK